MLVLVELCLDSPPGTTSPPPAPVGSVFSVRIASLYHETRDNPVESNAVVKAAIRKLYEILDGFRGRVGEKLDRNVAKSSLYLAGCHAVWSRKGIFELSRIKVRDRPYGIVE